MGQGGWIAGLRRRRSTIGLAASVVLLFNLPVSGAAGPLLTAAADPLEAFLAEHLCAPERDPGDAGPAKPVHRLPDCPACGTSCPMSGCASVNAAVAFVKPIQPPRARWASGTRS